MANVTYEGPSSRSDSSTVVYVDDQRFEAGFPVDVKDDELVAELREGSSERLKGHKFTVEEGDAQAKPQRQKAQQAEPASSESPTPAPDKG